MTPKKVCKTVKMAKRLHCEMSPAEVFLWQHLRKQDLVKMRRDHPFGPYALDFFCAKAKLAIEVDGISHDMGDYPPATQGATPTLRQMASRQFVFRQRKYCRVAMLLRMLSCGCVWHGWAISDLSPSF